MTLGLWHCYSLVFILLILRSIDNKKNRYKCIRKDKKYRYKYVRYKIINIDISVSIGHISHISIPHLYTRCAQSSLKVKKKMKNIGRIVHEKKDRPREKIFSRLFFFDNVPTWFRDAINFERRDGASYVQRAKKL